MLNSSTREFLARVGSLMGEPRNPEPNLDEFQALERRLGVTFPQAYKAILSAYGPGMICDDIILYHPTVGFPPYGLLGGMIDSTIEKWREHPYFWDEVIQGNEAPFSLGAQPGMLLPWADALNWVILFFRVTESEDWEVIEYSDGFHERSGLTFEKWILRYLSGGGSEGHFVTAKPGLVRPFFRGVNAGS